MRCLVPWDVVISIDFADRGLADAALAFSASFRCHWFQNAFSLLGHIFGGNDIAQICRPFLNYGGPELLPLQA